MKLIIKYKMPLKAVPAVNIPAATVIMSGLLGTQSNINIAKSNKQLVK